MDPSRELRQQAKKLRQLARMSELLFLAQNDPERLQRKLVGEQKSRFTRKMNTQITKALRGK